MCTCDRRHFFSATPGHIAFNTTSFSTRCMPICYINLLQPSGFFYLPQGLKLKNSTWCSLCVECFVRISEQTATFALDSIN